jgi:hypothetical protein
MKEARDRAYSFVDILNMNRDPHAFSTDAIEDFDLMFREDLEATSEMGSATDSYLSTDITAWEVCGELDLFESSPDPVHKKRARKRPTKHRTDKSKRKLLATRVGQSQ